MMHPTVQGIDANAGSSADCRGLIFNITRFSLHDGPGIRTTVFFKGCPLCCWWCHNPEGRRSQRDLMFFDNRCVLCGQCLEVCPHGAVARENGVISITDACRACGTCVDVCVAGARELAGRWVTVPEVLAETEKDRIFWEESGGGVTFSGGEPLLQPNFLEALLDHCRARKIHTVVETCGYAKKDLLLRLSPKVDLFLFDLKLFDSERHRVHTGQDNASILANLEALARSGRDVIVRYPVIPGVNADEENVRQMIQLLSALGLGRIHLLPFHATGAEKYRRLRLPSSLIDPGASQASRVEHIAEEFSRHGFEVRIGG